jgi:hypothetical protein
VNKNTEYRRCIQSAIESTGATIVSLNLTGSGHQVIAFEIGGRRGKFFFSTSPAQGRDLKAMAVARRVVRATCNRERTS